MILVFFKNSNTYFIILWSEALDKISLKINLSSFKFGWVANNTFFCDMTDSEHILNFDFTGTLNVK